MKQLTLYIFLVFGFVTAQAGTVYTTNGNGTDWNTATNWTPTGVPNANNWPNDQIIVNHNMTTSNDLRIIGAGSSLTINSGATLTISGGKSFYTNGSATTTINSGATLIASTVLLQGTVILDGTLIANNNMQLNGNITGDNPTITVTNNVTFGTTGFTTTFNSVNMTVGGDALLQNGKLIVGGGDINISGDFTSNGSAATTLTDTDLTIGGDLAIDNSTVISGSGTSVLTWGGVLSDSNPSSDGLSCGVPPYVSPINLSDCSAATPLPVEFFSIIAECTPKGTLIQWTTATEKNNSHFVIQKTTNTVDYTNIGQLEGAGTSSSLLNYDFYDTNSPSGIQTSYYRIKQIDYNGAFDFSKVVASTCQRTEVSKVQLYPTITSGYLYFNLLQETNYLEINFINSVGELVKTKTIDSPNTETEYNLPIDNLENGIYFVQIKTQGSLQVEKIVKQ